MWCRGSFNVSSLYLLQRPSLHFLFQTCSLLITDHVEKFGNFLVVLYGAFHSCIWAWPKTIFCQTKDFRLVTVEIFDSPYLPLFSVSFGEQEFLLLNQKNLWGSVRPCVVLLEARKVATVRGMDLRISYAEHTNPTAAVDEKVSLK